MRLSFKYLLAAIIIFVIGYTGVFSVLQDFTQYLANPFQYGLFQIKGNAENTLSFFTNLKSLRNQNLELLEKTYDLESKIAKLKELEFENKTLREQAGVKNENSAQNLLLARVIGIPFSNQNSEVLIDKGSEDGLKTGQTVLFKNFLVGSIVDVFAHRATVVFVTSPKLNVAVLDQSKEGRAKGITTGSFGTAIIMDKVLLDEEVVQGDIIVTSGQDGVFKPGLIAGKVVEVTTAPTEPIKKAKLETLVDLNKLEVVFIDLDSGKVK